MSPLDAFYAYAADDSHEADTEAFAERFMGHYEDFDTYAHQLADDVGLLSNVPGEISRYFNWRSWISDLKFDYTVLTAEEGVYIFRNI